MKEDMIVPVFLGIGLGLAICWTQQPSSERREPWNVYSNGHPIHFLICETNPVGLARIIVSTNIHWSLLETKPSNYGCLILGCRRDHSEMRIEREDIYIITRAEIVYEGNTNFLTLKCEKSLGGGSTRVQYSGVDYERCYSAWSPTNWYATGFYFKTNWP